MKQFLVLLAVLPLTLLIMIEFVLDTSINSKIDAINDIVYSTKELARQEGTFKNLIDSLKNDIASVAGVEVSDVVVDGTYIGEPIVRITSLAAFTFDGNIDDNALSSNLIHYHLSVPIEEMKSLGSLLSNRSRNYIYVLDSYVTSEYLGTAQ